MRSEARIVLAAFPEDGKYYTLTFLPLFMDNFNQKAFLLSLHFVIFTPLRVDYDIKEINLKKIKT